MKAAGLILLGGMCLGSATRAQDVAATATKPAAKPVGLGLVLGKPFSAVQEYDREQKLPDGTTLKTHETTQASRDSAGRFRREVRRDQDKIVWTYLIDPAAKVQYRWNDQQKIAYATPAGDPVPAREPNHPLQVGEVRDLVGTFGGKRTEGSYSLLPAAAVEGYAITGTRVVYYSDVLRDYIYYTRDQWRLPGYFLTMQEEITDFQYGHRTWHVHSFKKEEPSADLFILPKGYVVKPAETAESEQFE